MPYGEPEVPDDPIGSFMVRERLVELTQHGPTPSSQARDHTPGERCQPRIGQNLRGPIERLSGRRRPEI
jgi:hypothetical protein